MIGPTTALTDAAEDQAVAPPSAGPNPGERAYTDIEALFTHVTRATNELERQKWRCEIVTRCLPLADHIAYRYVGRGEPGEDLIQVARLGLVKAVNRYNPAEGPFLGFAIPTILGEVRRHFRDYTWGMHVPRGIKETNQRVRAAIDPMSQRLGRAPTASELAAELDIERETVVQCVEVAYAYRPVSLDNNAPGCGEDSLSRLSGEDPCYARIEDALSVAELMNHLPERERAMVQLRFGQGLSQSEIGKQLGISQVHVSRLLAVTLERLREHLMTDQPPPMADPPAAASPRSRRTRRTGATAQPA